MKTGWSERSQRAFTLIELLVVLAVLMILAAMVDWGPTGKAEARALRIQCVNNLKQSGLAFQVWEGDQTVRFPMELSVSNGGTQEFTSGPNAFRHFQIMSSELLTPKVLNCPADARFAATNWVINNSNISYFVGVEADPSNPTMILSGDHNITNGTPVRNGLLILTTNQAPGWTEEIHKKVGNILMADGSVQQVGTMSLRDAVAHTEFATNRLQMPILGP